MQTQTQPEASTSYDSIPYPGAAFSKSHPNHLAGLARMFGIDAQPPAQARVLELGCASGLNLLPMADAAPTASFLGIDSSRVQIEAGQRLIKAAGLKNIELRHQDILSFPADSGQFDYIIVHGVYSWVSDVVQKKILEICARHLAPTGIAYLSYNVLPGNDMRRSMREMVRFHTSALQQPAAKLRQARALLQFLADAVPGENSAYGLLVKDELGRVARAEDAFLYHDYLDAENSALYFHEFVARAESHQLQYLCESTFSEMLASNFSESVKKTLAQLDTIVAQEQYMDFLRNRMFRQTLLCHQTVKIRRNLTPDVVKSLAFQGLLLRPSQPVDLTPGVVIVYPAVTGQQISTGDLFLKAVLAVLQENALRAVGFSELLEQARARSRVHVERSAPDLAKQEEASLATNLLSLLSKGFVDVYAESPASKTELPEKPRASGFVRLQARTSGRITNRLNTVVPVDALGRVVIGHCDGTRTFEQLIALVVREAQGGILQVQQGKKPLKDPKRLEEFLTPQVRAVLDTLNRGALLTK